MPYCLLLDMRWSRKSVHGPSSAEWTSLSNTSMEMAPCFIREGGGIVSLLHIGILETSFSVVLGSSKLHLI